MPGMKKNTPAMIEMVQGSTTARARTVVWDVDGTLVESTDLGFEATNEVLARGGHAQISRADYLLGCRYTTPDRFSFHVGEEIPNGERGAALGADFDATYVARVSASTAGLFPGIERLLRSLALGGLVEGGARPHPETPPHAVTARAVAACGGARVSPPRTMPF